MEDMHEPKILIICLGNICRSPLMEGLLRKKIKQANLNWTVDSAGTGNWHIGDPPDPRVRETAKNHGLNLDDMVSRQVTQEDLDKYDLILAMDRKNLLYLQELAHTSEQMQKIHLVMDFTQLSQSEGKDVFDPYWDDSAFEEMYQVLDRASDIIIDRISQKAIS